MPLHPLTLPCNTMHLSTVAIFQVQGETDVFVHSLTPRLQSRENHGRESTLLLTPTTAMAVACSQCNGSTVWDDTAASAVCTSCGSLADPSQSVLTSQYEFPPGITSYGDSWDGGIRKRCRSSSSWALIDQGKEARDSRNIVSVFFPSWFRFLLTCTTS